MEVTAEPKVSQSRTAPDLDSSMKAAVRSWKIHWRLNRIQPVFSIMNVSTSVKTSTRTIATSTRAIAVYGCTPRPIPPSLCSHFWASLGRKWMLRSINITVSCSYFTARLFRSLHDWQIVCKDCLINKYFITSTRSHLWDELDSVFNELIGSQFFVFFVFFLLGTDSVRLRNDTSRCNPTPSFLLK